MREVVKTQFFTMVVFSEITEYTPSQSLGYSFHGSGMVGTQRYIFRPLEDRTELLQQVSISFKGFRRILNLFLPLTYARVAEWRLRGIKGILEAT
ncbi:MAG: hypothetical protein ACETV1_07550 [Candidatus Bathyarchaeia archaeon]